MSLPTRERGLKHDGPQGLGLNLHVAPYAGAWIETAPPPPAPQPPDVAPYAGAWIETQKRQGGPRAAYVAPYAGAWIETRYEHGGAGQGPPSLPTRERGLKHFKRDPLPGLVESLPTRERGLKRNPRHQDRK